MTIRQAVGAGAAALLAVLVLLLGHARNERDRARREASEALAGAALAQGQARLNGAEARALEAAQSRELRLTLQAKEAAYDIRRMEGADEPVPDAVLAVWADGVDRLREPPRGSAADHDAGG